MGMGAGTNACVVVGTGRVLSPAPLRGAHCAACCSTPQLWQLAVRHAGCGHSTRMGLRPRARTCRNESLRTFSWLSSALSYLSRCLPWPSARPSALRVARARARHEARMSGPGRGTRELRTAARAASGCSARRAGLCTCNACVHCARWCSFDGARGAQRTPRRACAPCRVCPGAAHSPWGCAHAPHASDLPGQVTRRLFCPRAPASWTAPAACNSR